MTERDRICKFLLFIFLVTLNSSLEAFSRRTKLKRHHGWLRKFQKKNNVLKPHNKHEDSSYKDFEKLERRFETIRDLGSIVRCRLHSDETTIVTGNSLICGGKRYKITPEAAKDAKATSRQAITYSPDGSPQDTSTTLQSGIYGKPIMDFLGGVARSNLLEPHDKYPSFGIYDKGLRSSDPSTFGRSNAVSMSFDQGRNYEDSFENISDGQGQNFGDMELNDISKAMESDYEKTKSQDSFYRDSQKQNTALGMDGAKETSNPFGQYWKSMKNSFYFTTPSLLAGTDPVGNSRHKIATVGQVRDKIARRTRTKIPTKKSSIQPMELVKSESQARREIPKPILTGGVKNNAKNSTTDAAKKRYFILGPRRVPLGMFAGVPGIGPWQYRYREPAPMARSMGPMPMIGPSQYQIERPVGPWNMPASQQGIARSFPPSSEWGTRAAPRYYDPIMAGSPVRVPMNPIYAQMRAIEFTGEPGLPAKGRFQYGVQPGNGPPFLGFASVPIMEPVPMSDSRANQPGFPEGTPEGGAMGAGFERENQGNEGGEPFSRGEVPFNFGRNEESEMEREHPVPGLVQGTERQLPSGGAVGLPMKENSQNYGQEGMPQESHEPAFEQSTFSSEKPGAPLEDASNDFERMTGPENYVPAPFYKPPSYNPHESEDYFPDGTNEKLREEETAYLQKNGYSAPVKAYKEEVKSPEGNAAELYEDENRQEQEREEEEEQRKRGHLSNTRIDVNGNRIEAGPNGKFVFTKEHVGFGPITVEAKTARSSLKDPSEDDK